MQSDGSPPWDDLRVLLAVHRHRSFLAAGRALGVSTSTAARRIEALEAALGRRLVHRSSAGTLVESDALELVSLAEQIELGLRALRRDEGERALAGTVRVSMGEGFVRLVTRWLCELRRVHPALELELVSETKMVDLARREADVGLRSRKSPSSAVVQRAVGRVQFGFYAAPSYVDRRLRGPRLAADDLRRQDFIGFEGTIARAPQAEWLGRQGVKRYVVRTNSDAAIVEAALQGQGIALLADPIAAALTGLVRLGCESELPSAPIYLAYHRELRNVPRVKLVIDTLDAAIRDGLREIARRQG